MILTTDDLNKLIEEHKNKDDAIEQLANEALLSRAVMDKIGFIHANHEKAQTQNAMLRETLQTELEYWRGLDSPQVDEATMHECIVHGGTIEQTLNADEALTKEWLEMKTSPLEIEIEDLKDALHMALNTLANFTYGIDPKGWLKTQQDTTRELRRVLKGEVPLMEGSDGSNSV